MASLPVVSRRANLQYHLHIHSGVISKPLGDYNLPAHPPTLFVVDCVCVWKRVWYNVKNEVFPRRQEIVLELIGYPFKNAIHVESFFGHSGNMNMFDH